MVGFNFLIVQRESLAWRTQLTALLRDCGGFFSGGWPDKWYNHLVAVGDIGTMGDDIVLAILCDHDYLLSAGTEVTQVQVHFMPYSCSAKEKICWKCQLQSMSISTSIVSYWQY